MIRFYLGTDERQRIWDIRKLRVLAGESLDATLSTSATSSPLRKRKADSAKRSVVEYSHDVVTKFDDSEEGVGLLRGDYAHDKSCSSAFGTLGADRWSAQATIIIYGVCDTHSENPSRS